MDSDEAHGAPGTPDASGDIVVTGAGLASGLGFGVEANWQRLLSGRSAIRQLDQAHFVTPLKLPVRLGSPVDRAALAERIRSAVPRQIWNTSSEVCHLWLLTAIEALAAAGLDDMPAPMGDRTGVYVGNGAGSAHLIEQEFANVYTAHKPAFRDVSRMVVPKYMVSSLAGQLSILKGFRGPGITLNTACSSGVVAVLTAVDALRSGRIDVAVTGGAEMGLSATVLKGFSNLAALTPQNELGAAACRPFDAGRKGFVLGEGAACLVLERASSAMARGAAPLARVLGGAITSEAHHLLAPEPDGAGMIRCINMALDESGVNSSRVAHVFAHGTGTLDNDRCEAIALQATCPQQPTVSATKALFGHAIGASGAMDAVAAVQVLRSGRVVPCINLDTPDPDCPINAARSSEFSDPGGGALVMVNSFAFGGQNAVVLLGHGNPRAG